MRLGPTSSMTGILNNRLYLGEVTHQGKVYNGEHEAIIETSLFEQVQAQLDEQRIRRTTRTVSASACPLMGKITLDAEMLLSGELPLAWAEQRQVLGMG